MALSFQAATAGSLGALAALAPELRVAQEANRGRRTWVFLVALTGFYQGFIRGLEVIGVCFAPKKDGLVSFQWVLQGVSAVFFGRAEATECFATIRLQDPMV